MNPPRVALYVRVSMREQKLDAQLFELRGYCRRMGWKNPVVYQEKESGAKVARTELDEMMKACRAGAVDKVVIWKLDRLGRSSAHLSQIIAEFRALKVGLIVTTQGIDTTVNSPATNVFLTMLGAMAEFDRENISERTRMGHAHARRNGRVPGRPRTSDQAIAKARTLRTKGLTLRQIAKSTGLSIGYLSQKLKPANP